jgi:hypothetical protein
MVASLLGHESVSRGTYSADESRLRRLSTVCSELQSVGISDKAKVTCIYDV